MEVKNFLLGYKELYIMQDTNMFNFSLDSVLLPNFVTLNKSDKRLLDIGTGNAPIPLILSTKTKAKIIGVEIQEESYKLALKSVELNKLEEQIDIVHDDINNYYTNCESDYFDVITCNPPFFKNTRKNDNDLKSIARHEDSLNLESLFKIARKLLRNNGKIAIVHRPERLVEIFEIMRKNNIEPKKIQLVYPFKNKEANILLVEGTKNGKVGLKILSPIYTHQRNGKYTSMIRKYFEGDNNESKEL